MSRYAGIILVCLAPLAGTAQPVSKTMLRLPDTGETMSYTGTFGEDADFTINAPFFTLNGDGTVTDTITGLMWQRTDGGEMTIEDATVYCDTLTLAGHVDWRLPDASEAFSILDHQLANPALDPAVFPVSAAEYWWTSDRQANDNTKVWATNAGGGIGNHPKSETISAGGIKRFHVRAVRDQSPPPALPSQFTNHADGTATDALTGLVWQRSSHADTFSWEDALSYADTLTLAGFGDWRLPNIKELRSINEESLVGPSLDGAVFGNAGARKYWSSTTLPNQTVKAWYLYTQFGITTYDLKTARHFVLCVRGGQDTTTGLIDRPASTLAVTVFPNPARDAVNIGFVTRGPFNAVLEIRDLTGRIVHQEATSGSSVGQRMLVWNGVNASPGTYLYQLSLIQGRHTARSCGTLLLLP